MSTIRGTLLFSTLIWFALSGCSESTCPTAEECPSSFTGDGGETCPQTCPDGGCTCPDGGCICPDGGGTCPDGGCTCPDGGGTCPDGGGTCPDCGDEDGGSSGPEVDCADGVDNDGDGDADCLDADCNDQVCQSWCVGLDWHAYLCAGGACVPPDVGMSCADANTCTDNVCVEGGTCQITFNNDGCSDLSACTRADTCAMGICSGILEDEREFGTENLLICPIGTCWEDASYSSAQEFKAPHPTLGHVGIFLSSGSTGPFEVRILSALPAPGATAGQVNQADLAAKTLAVTTVDPPSGGWAHAYFAPPLVVDSNLFSGTRYFLFVENNEDLFTNDQAAWKHTGHTSSYEDLLGLYDQGDMYYLTNTSAWTRETDRDWLFKIYCDVERPHMQECEEGFFDPETNLCWESPTSDTAGMNFADAMDYCVDLEVVGARETHTDWRLPNIEELRSLIRGCPGTEIGGECAVGNVSSADDLGPDCTGCYFLTGPHLEGCFWDDAMDDDCNGVYWSISEMVAASPATWTVNFAMAKLAAHVPRISTNRVRCVRDL